MACGGPQQRLKIPKDGPGPRGVPDCYYTSRVLNSTGRYVQFVKKLRRKEEEDKRGEDNKLKELHDTQISDFFIRCDRRSLINNVARRVDLCLSSYENDLAAKRKRLTALLQAEEEENIKLFIVQAQAGAEALWQDKKARLAFLLAKRKKEHEEKYKDTPLSKSSHVLGCIYKLRAKETEEFQLYQMRENKCKKMAEKEFDKMWHTVSMREAEALAARMEYEEIERARRDRECTRDSDQQVEKKRLQKERNKELLKQEALLFKQQLEEADRKEAEAERKRQARHDEVADIIKSSLKERQDTLQKMKEEKKLVDDTWLALSQQGLADDRSKEELRRRIEQDTVSCNRYLSDIKHASDHLELATDEQITKDATVQRDIQDNRRCEYLAKQIKAMKEIKTALVVQIKDRETDREKDRQAQAEEDEYGRQVYGQVEELLKNKQLMDKEVRIEHRRKLQEQIEYNKLLKERALKEEMEQREKCKAAQRAYDEEVGRMLCRPFFSDEQHPFMKQIVGGAHLQEKCPCHKPNRCGSSVPLP